MTKKTEMLDDGGSLLEKFKKRGDRYYLINVLSMRARQLMNGAKPTINVASLHTEEPARIVTAELLDKKLTSMFKDNSSSK